VVVDRSRYPVKKLRLEDEGREAPLLHLDAAARLELVEELTREAWTFMEGTWREPRLRRDVVRIIRSGR
jgi:hypothetical protein